jgi:hypothetical protein
LYFVEKSEPVDPEEVSFWKDALANNSPEAFKDFR